MNLNQLFESLSADQRRAGQLPADFRAPNTSPQLSGPYPGRNATRGYLVGEQGVSEGRADSGNPLQRIIDFAVKNGYQVKTSPKRTRATFINRDIDHEIRATLYREPGDDMIWVNFDDRTSGMSGNDPADTFYDTFVRAYQDAAQDVSAGHADQQRKIFKGENGQPVGEVGIDRESSPGVGQYYMKHYASGTDNSGYDSFEEAVEELRHLVLQGVSEAMKPSDIPPSRRDRLTMRDIEAERPQGAYRFRVTFPDGATADFMDFEAAQERAAADRGRITRLREEKKKSNPRIERILKMLRARHPQAEDDLEALIYDFRSQQAQDRTDIARLDRENDMEEADIERLEQMLDVIRRRRGEAAAEPVQEDDIDDAMRDFLARGGKIHQEPTRMPRLGTRLRQHGSRHIGQGREARAGQLSGRGANTNPGSNKPVVTAESLRDGEYHVATVTLDDGSVKRVRITTDEGFRDRIKQHFQKQGRQVKDIDVDYAVRSELDETTINTIEQALAQRMAAEDVLGDVRRRLGDVLKQREQQRAERMPTKQAPQDVLGDPVKKIDLGGGKILMIHGNEDDGFRIHLGQRVMPTRFATMEQAEMATRMFEAKRDACYHKVKSRYKVWPSAYASGALVQCRKQGAANWGKGSKD